jgi:hypothetical protein
VLFSNVPHISIVRFSFRFKCVLRPFYSHSLDFRLYASFLTITTIGNCFEHLSAISSHQHQMSNLDHDIDKEDSMFPESENYVSNPWNTDSLPPRSLSRYPRLTGYPYWHDKPLPPTPIKEVTSITLPAPLEYALPYAGRLDVVRESYGPDQAPDHKASSSKASDSSRVSRFSEDFSSGSEIDFDIIAEISNISLQVNNASLAQKTGGTRGAEMSKTGNEASKEYVVRQTNNHPRPLVRSSNNSLDIYGRNTELVNCDHRVAQQKRSSGVSAIKRKPVPSRSASSALKFKEHIGTEKLLGTEESIDRESPFNREVPINMEGQIENRTEGPIFSQTLVMEESLAARDNPNDTAESYNNRAGHIDSFDKLKHWSWGLHPRGSLKLDPDWNNAQAELQNIDRKSERILAIMSDYSVSGTKNIAERTTARPTGDSNDAGDEDDWFTSAVPLGVRRGETSILLDDSEDERIGQAIEGAFISDSEN